MIRKILCKITGQHNKYVSNRFCNGIYDRDGGFDLITCSVCKTITKRKCDIQHCDCCGKHCNAEEIFFKPWHLMCKCTNCQIRRTIPCRLWYCNRSLFLQLYSSLVKSHSQEKVDEALSAEEYYEIVREMQKYKVLL